MQKKNITYSELYERLSCGTTPRAGDTGKGIEKAAVPFTAFTENFSSIPFRAPPPFGKDIEGTSMALDFVARSLELTYS